MSPHRGFHSRAPTADPLSGRQKGFPQCGDLPERPGLRRRVLLPVEGRRPGREGHLQGRPPVPVHQGLLEKGEEPLGRPLVQGEEPLEEQVGQGPLDSGGLRGEPREMLSEKEVGIPDAPGPPQVLCTGEHACQVVAPGDAAGLRQQVPVPEARRRGFRPLQEEPVGGRGPGRHGVPGETGERLEGRLVLAAVKGAEPLGKPLPVGERGPEPHGPQGLQRLRVGFLGDPLQGLLHPRPVGLDLLGEPGVLPGRREAEHQGVGRFGVLHARDGSGLPQGLHRSRCGLLPVRPLETDGDPQIGRHGRGVQGRQVVQDLSRLGDLPLLRQRTAEPGGGLHQARQETVPVQLDQLPVEAPGLTMVFPGQGLPGLLLQLLGRGRPAPAGPLLLPVFALSSHGGKWVRNLADPNFCYPRLHNLNKFSAVFKDPPAGSRPWRTRKRLTDHQPGSITGGSTNAPGSEGIV